jgi:hypothetical protein
MFSIQEQLLRRILKRFRGGLVYKALSLSYHSTSGSTVIKKKKNGVVTRESGRDSLTRGW